MKLSLLLLLIFFSKKISYAFNVINNISGFSILLIDKKENLFSVNFLNLSFNSLLLFLIFFFNFFKKL